MGAHFITDTILCNDVSRAGLHAVFVLRPSLVRDYQFFQQEILCAYIQGYLPMQICGESEEEALSN